MNDLQITESQASTEQPVWELLGSTGVGSSRPRVCQTWMLLDIMGTDARTRENEAVGRVSFSVSTYQNLGRALQVKDYGHAFCLLH